MVDTQDLYKKLTRGAVFTKRDKSSSKTLLEKETPDIVHDRQRLISTALDFFGDSDKPEQISHCDLSSSDDIKDQQQLPLQLTSHHTLLSFDKKVKKSKKKSTAGEIHYKEEISALRNASKIHVSGMDIPDPIESFQQLSAHYKVPSYLLRNLTTLNYNSPTPIQMQTIPLMLHGRDVLGCAPTGSGKTAAFIVPILTHLKWPASVGFRAVIVSPTRELAQQTYRECVRLSNGSGLRIHVLTKATASVNSFGDKSSQKFDMLVTTPNRLVHLLSLDPPGISLINVEWLIFDECDKLFEDGITGFKEQIDGIYTSCTNASVKRGFFSATLASQVEEFCKLYCDNYVRIIIGLQNSATESVHQELLFVGQESGKLLAIREMIQKGFVPPVLVFVQSIERAKELFHELIYDGMNVDVIHSERTLAQRDNIIKCFRDGKIWLLICTDLMGRGIDFKGVNTVINYDFPTSAVSYIHRIGRTGRAGRDGNAITFYTTDDLPNVRSIANVLKSSGCSFPDWMMEVKKQSKVKRKELNKKPINRDSIKTQSKYDMQKRKRKKEMVSASKRRKLN